MLIALAVHIATFGLATGLPELLDRKPILDEVVTVNLVSLPEAPAPPPETSAPEPVVKPQAAKVPVNPEAALEPASQPVRPVSLKPIKRKIRKTDPEKLAAEEARRKREQERLAALARAKAEEERARKAAEDARAALAEMLRRQHVQSTPAVSRRSTGQRQIDSIVERNYYAALYDRIQQFWILPEMRRWDPSLETVVVVTILRDGTIAGKVVEKKSRDSFFDQYVMKTLEKAAPLPGFPKLMNKDSIEVGFRFRPGELTTI